MSSFQNNLRQNPIYQPPNMVQQSQHFFPTLNVNTNDSMTPLDDIQYLVQNAQCLKYLRELSNTHIKNNTKKNETFIFTNQFLYGSYMPPYYSVLNSSLMEKFVVHLKNPKAPISMLLSSYKEIIKHEQELFFEWLSTLWEKDLKNRRLNVIPYIENYIKSVCDFSSGYIRSYYNGTYRSTMKIDYNKEDGEMINKIEMIYCERIKKSNLKYKINFPTVDIKNVEQKISFTDGVYNPPQKLPFVKDELCQTLSKDHSSDVNICLSGLKCIMNLEKSNGLWLIPVNINIDTDNKKTIYIGGALSTGLFSQQEKCWYYLRKEVKKKFRKPFSTSTDNESVKNISTYNYDKWTLNVKVNDEVKKTYNLIIRNKPHMQNYNKANIEQSERVLIPKIEYQPEFGFEKLNEEQLVEYWLDTYFRTPKTNFTLVSVQYNMDIMMIKQKNIEINNLLSNDKKKMYLERLCLTLDKLTQLGKGEYIMMHNPKKTFQVELYQSSMYGGFNLLNMHFVLQQAEASNSLAWNTIDTEVICPIHDHFKVAPCMFRPNPVNLNIQLINEQVGKYQTVLENKEKIEKERLAKRKVIKKEKNKVKRKLKRENDNLYKMKRKILNK